MRARHAYLGLCLLGTVLPYARLAPWVASYGLDGGRFLSDLTSTRVGEFFAWDVVLSAFALFLLVRIEGARLRMRRLWIPVVATLTVGVSLGLPLFLYQRQLALDEERGSA